MPKETPQTPENLTADPYFSGYVHISGDAGLTLHETATGFAKAMSNKAAQGLVVYVAPAHVIACLMQDGTAPGDAQDLWRNQAAPYLALLRKTRRRLTMHQLPLEDAAAAIQAVVSERLPEAAESALPTLPVAPELTEPFWQALAQLHISQDTQTSDAIDIVQSHSIGPVDPLNVDDIAPVLWERWHLRDAQNKNTAAQNTTLVEQIVGLEQDLAGIHNNLEAALHDQQSHVQELVAQIDAHAKMTQQQTSARNTAQQALEEAAAQIKTQQDIQADMQSRIDAKNKQIGTLTAERNWVRERRKAQEEETSAHKKHLAQLKAEKADLQSALALIEKTYSEKAGQMAAQTRQQEEAAQSALALAEKNHDEITDQMTAQICQLEEAVQLSSATQSNDNDDTVKETLRQVVRQLEISLSMSQTRQNETTQALHHAQEESTALQAKLDALHASTSWRATKPMRSVSLLVRK